MAKCWDYKTGEKCSHFMETGQNQCKSGKKLSDWSYYCTDVVSGARKICGKADWTGRTPKWCPRGRDEDAAKAVAH